MKIAILDGYTMNPGDLSWDGLESLGELKYYDRTRPEEVVERSADCEIILTNKVKITKEHIKQLGKLKYIGVTATGYNVINLNAATEAGITVTNVSGYSTNAVTQHVFAMIFTFTNRIAYYSDTVRKGRWHESADFTYWDRPLTELAGKTLGIIGFGTIGQAVGRIGAAFGMKIIAYHTHPERDQADFVDFVSMEELAKKSDFISLHCPLKESNQGFINADFLHQMKSNSILINTARGPLVNHDDLANAIEANKIAGAALDVYEAEPPLHNHPIFGLERVLITPHQAWASLESRKRLMEGVINNIKAFIEGNPVNVVS